MFKCFFIFNLDIHKRACGHKEHFCVFCEEKHYALPRHFERNHKNEKEVAEALSCTKKSKERRNAWAFLTRKGDYEANLKSLKEHRENLAVVRGTSEEVVEFVPCPHCFGFFNSKTLYKHAKVCFMQTSEKPTTKCLHSGRALLSTAVSEGTFKDVHELILSRMKRDDLHLVIRNDTNLLLYAAVQLQKKEKQRYHDIRYSLRCLTRILIQFRKQTDNGNAVSGDLVLPENYNQTLQAVKTLSGYSGPRSIETPTSFLKAGFCLRNLALIIRAIALRECSSLMIEKLRNFIELYETDWQMYATNARACHDCKKANAPEELPLESDVKIFRQFIMDEMKVLIERIENEVSVNDLKSLSKYTLARVMTFNARRGGEVSKLQLTHWEGVEDGRWKRRTDVDALEDPVERMLAERLQLCYIEGKKKRGSKSALVPVLFTEETVQAIRLIVKHRGLTGNQNEYIFSCGEMFLRGWDTLQGITKKIASLEKPKLITPTRTRKLLATIMQLLDMTDAELTWLTNHFGHSKDVHMSWYRKEDSTIELSKVAKVLVAVDSGNNIKNKKIDQVLSFDDPDEVGPSQNESNSDNETGGNYGHIHFNNPEYILTYCRTGSIKRPGRLLNYWEFIRGRGHLKESGRLIEQVRYNY